MIEHTLLCEILHDTAGQLSANELSPGCAHQGIDVRKSNQGAILKAMPVSQPLCSSGFACFVHYCLAPHPCSWNSTGPDSVCSRFTSPRLAEGQQRVKHYRLALKRAVGGWRRGPSKIHAASLYLQGTGWMFTLREMGAEGIRLKH